MKRFKLIAIAAVITIICYGLMISLEKKVADLKPTIKVVWVARNISARTPLNASSFVIKDVPIDSYSTDFVVSIKDIKGRYAKENIYANEPLNKNRIGNQRDAYSTILSGGKREVSLSFTNLADCVGGTLREGDKVDIALTNVPSAANSTITTTTKLEGVLITEAKDSTGRNIIESDNSTPATVLIFETTPESAHLLSNLDGSGKIRLLRTPQQDKEYNPITVVNGIVLSENKKK